MKILFRGAFIFIIIVGVVAQAIQITRIGEEHLTTIAVSAAAARIGLTEVDRTPDDLLVFTSSECPDRINIQLLNLDGRSGADAPEPADSRSQMRYVFLGSVQDRLDVFALRGRWLLANTFFVMGLRSSKPGSDILRVMLPESCSDLIGINWGLLSAW